MISDWVPSRDRVFRLSELMNSLMHFFPRSYLPAIANAGERNIVTLPTGEEVEFNAVTKEILGGSVDRVARGSEPRPQWPQVPWRQLPGQRRARPRRCARHRSAARQ